MSNEMNGEQPERDRPDDRIALEEAARLLEMSPELVLHHIRQGDLRLQRRDVKALREREAPQRQALADLNQGLEDVETQPPSGEAHPPEAIEQLRDLKPLRQHGEAFVPDETEERLSQLNHAPGGRIVLGVEELSEAEIEAIRNARVAYELRRDPGESDADFAARRALFEDGGRLVFDIAAMPIEEGREPVVEPDDDTVRRRNAVFQSIVLALEASGITGHEQPDFAIEHSLRADFFAHATGTNFSGITLDRLAALYDAAAGKAGWLSFQGILDEHLVEAGVGRYLPPWEPGHVTRHRPIDLHDSPQVASRYYTISFPLIPGDEGMRNADIRFKYSLLDALAPEYDRHRGQPGHGEQRLVDQPPELG